MAQVLQCSSKRDHLLEEKTCLCALSPGSAPVQPRLKTENRPWRKTRILCATGTPASRSLCDPFPTLDQLQGESFYWNVARPDLSSGKRQAGSLLYTVIHFKGLGGGGLHTPAHTQSLQSRTTQDRMYLLMVSQKGLTLLYPSTYKLNPLKIL